MIVLLLEHASAELQPCTTAHIDTVRPYHPYVICCAATHGHTSTMQQSLPTAYAYLPCLQQLHDVCSAATHGDAAKHEAAFCYSVRAARQHQLHEPRVQHCSFPCAGTCHWLRLYFISRCELLSPASAMPHMHHDSMITNTAART